MQLFFASDCSVCCYLCVLLVGSDAGAVDLSSLDFLKESFHMAGSYDWTGVDLTQFPGEFLLVNFNAVNVNTRTDLLTLFIIMLSYSQHLVT